jgi:steroid 5-alpha reductase family enzyme
MKLKYPVNLHKALTAIYVIILMFVFDNFALTTWIYLALHGSYGFLWILKDRIFPDKQWEKEVGMAYGIFVFFILGLYWIAPWIIVTQDVHAPSEIIAAAISLNVIGVMLHFSSDAQKYFTLKYKSGLITEGFFKRNRNTNYLGELMIYLGFAMLSMHWLGYVGITAFFIGAFIPNMIKKDKSLSRYHEFELYSKKSFLFIPWL